MNNIVKLNKLKDILTNVSDFETKIIDEIVNDYHSKPNFLDFTTNQVNSLLSNYPFKLNYLFRVFNTLYGERVSKYPETRLLDELRTNLASDLPELWLNAQKIKSAYLNKINTDNVFSNTRTTYKKKKTGSEIDYDETETLNVNTTETPKAFGNPGQEEVDSRIVQRNRTNTQNVEEVADITASFKSLVFSNVAGIVRNMFNTNKYALLFLDQDDDTREIVIVKGDKGDPGEAASVGLSKELKQIEDKNKGQDVALANIKSTFDLQGDTYALNAAKQGQILVVGTNNKVAYIENEGGGSHYIIKNLVANVTTEAQFLAMCGNFANLLGKTIELKNIAGVKDQYINVWGASKKSPIAGSAYNLMYSIFNINGFSEHTLTFNFSKTTGTFSNITTNVNDYDIVGVRRQTNANATKNNAQDVRLTNIETYNTTQEGKININIANIGTNANAIAVEKNINADQETRIDALEVQNDEYSISTTALAGSQYSDLKAKINYQSTYLFNSETTVFRLTSINETNAGIKYFYFLSINNLDIKSKRLQVNITTGQITSATLSKWDASYSAHYHRTNKNTKDVQALNTAVESNNYHFKEIYGLVSTSTQHANYAAIGVNSYDDIKPTETNTSTPDPTETMYAKLGSKLLNKTYHRESWLKSTAASTTDIAIAKELNKSIVVDITIPGTFDIIISVTKKTDSDVDYTLSFWVKQGAAYNKVVYDSVSHVITPTVINKAAYDTELTRLEVHADDSIDPALMKIKFAGTSYSLTDFIKSQATGGSSGSSGGGGVVLMSKLTTATLKPGTFFTANRDVNNGNMTSGTNHTYLILKIVSGIPLFNNTTDNTRVWEVIIMDINHLAEKKGSHAYLLLGFEDGSHSNWRTSVMREPITQSNAISQTRNDKDVLKHILKTNSGNVEESWGSLSTWDGDVSTAIPDTKLISVLRDGNTKHKHWYIDDFIESTGGYDGLINAPKEFRFRYIIALNWVSGLRSALGGAPYDIEQMMLYNTRSPLSNNNSTKADRVITKVVGADGTINYFIGSAGAAGKIDKAKWDAYKSYMYSEGKGYIDLKDINVLDADNSTVVKALTYIQTNAKGDKGDQGNQGNTGATGAAGADGAKGDPGFGGTVIASVSALTKDNAIQGNFLKQVVNSATIQTLIIKSYDITQSGNKFRVIETVDFDKLFSSHVLEAHNYKIQWKSDNSDLDVTKTNPSKIVNPIVSQQDLSEVSSAVHENTNDLLNTLNVNRGGSVETSITNALKVKIKNINNFDSTVSNLNSRVVKWVKANFNHTGTSFKAHFTFNPWIDDPNVFNNDRIYLQIVTLLRAELSAKFNNITLDSDGNIVDLIIDMTSDVVTFNIKITENGTPLKYGYIVFNNTGSSYYSTTATNYNTKDAAFDVLGKRYMNLKNIDVLDGSDSVVKAKNYIESLASGASSGPRFLESRFKNSKLILIDDSSGKNATRCNYVLGQKGDYITHPGLELRTSNIPGCTVSQTTYNGYKNYNIKLAPGYYSMKVLLYTYSTEATGARVEWSNQSGGAHYYAPNFVDQRACFVKEGAGGYFELGGDFLITGTVQWMRVLIATWRTTARTSAWCHREGDIVGKTQSYIRIEKLKDV